MLCDRGSFFKKMNLSNFCPDMSCYYYCTNIVVANEYIVDLCETFENYFTSLVTHVSSRKIERFNETDCWIPPAANRFGILHNWKGCQRLCIDDSAVHPLCLRDSRFPPTGLCAPINDCARALLRNVSTVMVAWNTWGSTCPSAEYSRKQFK